MGLAPLRRSVSAVSVEGRCLRALRDLRDPDASERGLCRVDTGGRGWGAPPATAPIVQIGQERRPGPRPRLLALQQIINLSPDAGVVENAKPARDDFAIGIDQEILRLRRRSQLGSLGVMRGVIDVENHKLNPTRVRFLQPTHGRLIAAAGRSPRGPRLKKGEAGRDRLGNRLRRRRLRRTCIARQHGPQRRAAAKGKRSDKQQDHQSNC